MLSSVVSVLCEGRQVCIYCVRGTAGVYLLCERDGRCVFTVCVCVPVSLVPLGEKRLMDVKLGELGSWLGKRDFTPNGVLASIRNGHDRYYNKYINVKKGGIGGVAMLLVGYVALSYMWEYDHLKHDRWRKYH
ncbi:ATP synthase subunit f, mitochondrial isoform X1 [Oncorhynchus mykiss]|uniref:ATP synthase subunit f, mitochondrial isoform X1 n=1 Tax=Oncorhynchus mykiss TaxID=8022 RepID=UPI0018789D50|nr:ATP synthase subunit f, mitochondrial isoform X1 [Oncorhynchus mykiss]